MIIDSHTHMIHGRSVEAIEYIGGASIRRQLDRLKAVTRGKPHASDVAIRVAQMDRFNVDYQIATPLPTMDANKLGVPSEVAIKITRMVNDGMARLTEESRGRVLCAGSVAMNALDCGGLDEMDRAFRSLGLRAFSVMTNIEGKPLDAMEFRPFWHKAAELNSPVFIHPADPVNPDGRPYESGYYLMHVFGWPFETTLALSRLVFSGIMEQLPGLRIISHHLGGMIPFYWGRMEEDYLPELEKVSGVNMKKPLKEYFGKFFHDTAIGINPWALRLSYELFGPGQLLFATDAPFGPGNGDSRQESYPRLITESGLPAGDVERILAGNAARIFGIVS